MADTKLTDLTQITAPANGDYGYVVESPSGTPLSKYALISDFLRLGYGDISVTGGAATQTPAAATWTKVTQFTAETTGVNVTTSHANDKITLANTGVYMANWSCAFVGAADEYRLAIYWNAVVASVPMIQTIPDANEHHVSLTVQIPVTATAKDVEAYVYSVGGNIFDVKESALSVWRIA